MLVDHALDGLQAALGEWFPFRPGAVPGSLRLRGVTLEFREHALGDQLEAALRRLRVGPFVGQCEVTPEPTRLLLQPFDLFAGHLRRPDRTEA